MYTKPYAIIAALVFIFTLEGVFPHRKGRQQRLPHAVPHVLTALLNGVLTRLLLAGITLQAASWTEARTAGIMNLFTLPSPVRTALIFVLFDIWMYLWHMVNHRSAFLWRFHRAHHADTEMDTTTALRFHPGELILSAFARLPVIVIIGMSYSELIIFEIMLNLSTLFHHSNLGIPEKWDRMLRVVIVTPDMHRVHHSVERFETDSNFTSLLSVWDRLARTFRMREDTRTVVFGLPVFRETRYQRLKGFLITPFV
ncbi:MAG TPA: sterol desaturase family protein [Nitrospirota bacterium]|nr:sterol desaturase family protein [Nitrospirota bacterium]